MPARPKKNDTLVTNGGRVLGVTALGQTLQEAHDKAYELDGQIQWDGVYYRHDIGIKGLPTK